MVAALCPGKAGEENKEYDESLGPTLSAPCGQSGAGVARTKKEKKRKKTEIKRARKKRGSEEALFAPFYS